MDKDRFLRDVTNHQMTVIRCDGVDRHLRFSDPETIYYGFDLITWPGHLCITGDCGTYVFQRLEDMFSFFRNEKGELNINAGYWHEKVLAQDRNNACEKYSEDKFKNKIKECFDRWAQDKEETIANEAWGEIEDDVLNFSENPYSAMEAAMCFKYINEDDDLDFNDFWEVSLDEYTIGYLWCLYAIVWGISEHDKSQTDTVRRIRGHKND